MTQCEHLNNSVCAIATNLAGNDILPIVSQCEYCTKQAEPSQAINKVTVSLALKGTMNPLTKYQIRKDYIHLLTTVKVSGPGTELQKILDSIGVREPVDCDCKSYANLMDKWGAEECKLRKQEIISHLTIQSITWLDMLKVALAGYLTTDALVNEAIKRADSNEPLKAKKYTITGRA